MPDVVAFSRPGRLYGWEKAGLVLLAGVVVGLGALTVVRSAYQSSPKTDFQVYARAAWAVAAGEDPYVHTDNNGWHYVYPPAFAILLRPLADPPAYLPRGGYLSFGAEVAVWFAIGLLCVVYTVHALAAAVLPGAVRGSRRWWYARLVPAYVCFGGIGLTLSRGQVNTVLVALVAAGFVAAVRGRRAASGAWLAGAAVLKVIPTFLVLFPIVRCDWRAVAGGVAAAALLLVALPAAVWGVDGMIAANRTVAATVLAPGVAEGGDKRVDGELTGASATYSQSVRGAVNAWIHPDRETRPAEVAPAAKWAHLVSAAVMVGLTLVAARRRLTPEPADQLVFLGCLCTLMMLVTPVSHMHYYAMVLPLVCGLWLRSLAMRPGAACADRATLAVLVAWGLLTAVPLLPGVVFDWLRECGFGTVPTIGLWAWGLRAMGRRGVANTNAVPVDVRRAA